MSELTDALEAWRDSVRELDAAMPWTAPWIRARRIEEDRRLAYQTLATRAESLDVRDYAISVERPAAVRDRV
jgi:hypothetical protein